MSGEQVLEVQLQKAYTVVLKEVENLLNVLSSKETRSTLSYLNDYLAQHQCCQRVNLKDGPLAEFPDLKARLTFKLSFFIEGKIEALRQITKTIEDAHAKISSEQAQVMSTYEQMSERPGPVSLTQGTPLRPPLSQMMEWLADIEQDVFFLLVEKRCLLNELDFRSEESLQRLQKDWTSDHELSTKMTHIKTYLHFFMTEKL